MVCFSAFGAAFVAKSYRLGAHWYTLSDMLNFAALRILSDPLKVPTPAARLFLRLICDLDIRKFRALNAVHLCHLYNAERFEISSAINKLCAIGLLERGPLAKRPRLNTYRVNPAYLLSPRDLEEHFRETREIQERLSLLPRKWARTVA